MSPHGRDFWFCGNALSIRNFRFRKFDIWFMFWTIQSLDPIKLCVFSQYFWIFYYINTMRRHSYRMILLLIINNKTTMQPNPLYTQLKFHFKIFKWRIERTNYVSSLIFNLILLKITIFNALNVNRFCRCCEIYLCIATSSLMCSVYTIHTLCIYIRARYFLYTNSVYTIFISFPQHWTHFARSFRPYIENQTKKNPFKSKDIQTKLQMTMTPNHIQLWRFHVFIPNFHYQHFFLSSV